MLFKVKERKGSDAKNIKNVKQTLPGDVKNPGVVERRYFSGGRENGSECDPTK
jgi:hypothetical protein